VGDTVRAAPAFESISPRARLALRWVSLALGALLGTGGCGTVLVAAINVAGSASTVARRVEAIEVKLDAWRDEQHRLGARADVVDRRLDALESNMKALDSRQDSCQCEPRKRYPEEGRR
jgi:uncharacterized protein YceK